MNVRLYICVTRDKCDTSRDSLHNADRQPGGLQRKLMIAANCPWRMSFFGQTSGFDRIWFQLHCNL